MRKMFSTLRHSFSSESANPANPARSAPLFENLEGRQLFSGAFVKGVNGNSIRSSTYQDDVNMMHDTGSKSVRLWISIDSYSHSETGVFKYIRKFHNDGFDITATVVSKHSDSAAAVQSYYGWLADDLGGSVDRFQVGNEVDRAYSNLGTYVNNVLKPAAAGLHSQGEKVVSGSVSWNPDDIKTMVNDGMLNYVDYVGYHPYRNTVADLKKCVAEVKALAGSKPLIATEWNSRGHENNKAAWNQGIKDFWPTIRDNFYAAYYFCANVCNSLAGPSGILKNGSKNGEFYDTFKGLGSGGDGSTPTQPVTPPVIPDPGGGGNTPSQTGAPTLSGFRIIDAITGKVIPGLENVTSGKTISLASLKHKQIQILAQTGSTTQSVRFSYTGRGIRTENSAPYTAFGDSSNHEAAWSAVKGSYTLSATAFSADNAKGKASATKTLILKFV